MFLPLTKQVNQGEEDYTRICPMFVSDHIHVLKEEEAFSFEELISEVGGTLGLFIGFNFVMIWDFIVRSFEMIFRRGSFLSMFLRLSMLQMYK